MIHPLFYVGFVDGFIMPECASHAPGSQVSRTQRRSPGSRRVMRMVAISTLTLLAIAPVLRAVLGRRLHFHHPSRSR